MKRSERHFLSFFISGLFQPFTRYWLESSVSTSCYSTMPSMKTQSGKEPLPCHTTFILCYVATLALVLTSFPLLVIFSPNGLAKKKMKTSRLEGAGGGKCDFFSLRCFKQNKKCFSLSQLCSRITFYKACYCHL